ncbi:MAG TPA: T9SS type A sorting domain-containing protein, partial [Bacteroidia bacterium]|nr:T9SS type A sorting domain-containing protein [Bacteroidia bacterium]
ISVAQTFDINGNPIWKRQNTNFNTSLIAGFGGSQQDPDFFLVGEDDNGSSMSSDADPTNFNSITWTGYSIGDGKEKYIDYSDSTDWFSDASAYGVTFNRDTTGSVFYGWHADFDETDPWGFRDFGINQPVLQDPYRPNIMYKADNFLARSFDYGETSDFIFAEGGCPGDPPTAWYTVETALAVCRLNPEVMYIATYNNQPSYMYTPRILKTTMATTMPSASAGPGAYCPYWTDIAPPLPPGLIGGPPLGFHYSGIAVSDYDPNKIWVSYQYDGASTGIPAIKVMTYDGTTWTDYSTGLPPAISVTNMVYESGSNDGLYIGTSCGVYYRNASMNSWTPYMTNHPNVLVRDMEINYGNNTVRTGTLGRGIWSSPLSCPTTSSIMFNNTTTSNNGFIEASSFISFQNVTVTNGTNIFRAGDYIDMLPDFLVTANATTNFYAFIHGCSGPGNSFRTAPPSPEEGDQPKTEKHDDELSVYPNPTNGIFTIRYPLWDETSKQASVAVYDFEGKLILQKTVHAGERIDVDLSDKPVGIYFVRFISPDGVKSAKVIHE